MTDEELVKRLRKRQEFEFIDGYKRIEWEDDDALEAADRIEALEAKLAKAVGRLTAMRDDRVGYRHVSHYRRGATVTLAEIEGDNP